MKGGVFMLYVGIDIAKFLHVAVVLSPTGEVLSGPFSFENSRPGFELLLSKLPKRDPEALLFGYESTAHYGKNLGVFLLAHGFHVGILNPLQTSSLRKTNLRNAKTDSIDALIIAQALSLGLHSMLSNEPLYDALWGLCVTRNNLMTARSRAKIQLVTYVDHVFPELAAFFKDNLHIATSYALLKVYTTPALISKVRIDTLTKRLSRASRGKYALPQAQTLKTLARSSVGVDNPALTLQIRLAIEQVELYSKQIEVTEKQIDDLLLPMESPILTIPGMGHIQAAVILSSLRNIHRFDHPCKVLAFAGLDPVVRQSGNFKARTTRMSKRGNSLLRYALILASHNVVRNNAVFSAYYLKKINEGKSHYNALGHVAFKLIRVIYKMLNHPELTFSLE